MKRRDFTSTVMAGYGLGVTGCSNTTDQKSPISEPERIKPYGAQYY